MVQRNKFYINGAWVDPVAAKTRAVINPATEKPLYDIALGSAADVDKAVSAARTAFETYSQTTREERVALLTRVIEVYKSRAKDR
jgi:aldehyde dehydrogenase (NAD+)